MVLSIGSASVWPGENSIFANGPMHYQSLFDSVGTGRFYGELAGVLAELCRIEHLHLFRVGESSPHCLASISHDGSREAERQFKAYMDRSLWRYDDTVQQLGARDDMPPVLLRTIADEHSCNNLRHHWREEGFAERLMLFGNVGKTRLAMTAVRVGRDRHFTGEEIARLASATGVLLPMAAKHLDFEERRDQILDALTSLPMIEKVLENGPVQFPRREMQVCARLLYGLNANSIAADLGIGLESVRSYRKRIYERLGVGCYREMLLWYLAFARRVEFAEVATAPHLRS